MNYLLQFLKNEILIVVLSFGMCLNTYSQITTNEQPMSTRLNAEKPQLELKAPPPISLKIPNMNAVLAEDSVNDKSDDKGFRVGIKIPVTYNSDKDGQWTKLDDGALLWQLTLSAEKAQSLDLTFSRFWLPDSGKFFVYNSQTLETIGAITSKYLRGDKKNPAKFSTGIVRGEIITLEYYQPKGVDDSPIIEVSGVYYGYRTLSTQYNDPQFGRAGDCQVNVNCPEGNDWTNEKRSVVRILVKGPTSSEWCSGSLVMNTSLDFTPYVLSANHCALNQSFDAAGNPDASESIFYWRFETAGCLDTQEPGNLSTVGATLVANAPAAYNDAYGDFALYLLHQDPRFLDDYIPYYLGWDRSGSTGIGGVCIHHPRGDAKKISTYSCAPLSTDYLSDSLNTLGSYWRVAWIETANGRGTIEPGSSGAPLINLNHKLIGQLHGGHKYCSSIDPAGWFGKLQVSWNGNGSPYYWRRLRDWLDPVGTNQTSISGQNSNQITIIGQTIICGTEIYYVNDLPSNYTVEWKFQNSASGLSNLIVQNSPAQNECTINLPSGQDINETLVADIKYNGQLVKSVTKGIYNTHTIGGAFSQEAGSSTPAISLTFFSGAQPISVYHNALVTIMSGALANKNVSYAGSSLAYWQYNSSLGKINLKFMPAPACQSITINAYTLNSCDKSTISVNTMLSRNTSPSQLSISVVDDNVNFIVSKNDNDKDLLSEERAYKIEIAHSVTGQVLYSGVMTGNSLSVNTSGWKPAIYIVNYYNGDETISQKFTIK